MSTEKPDPVQLELPFEPPLEKLPTCLFCQDCLHYDNKTYPKVTTCANPQLPSPPEPLIYSRIRCGGKWWEPAK